MKHSLKHPRPVRLGRYPKWLSPRIRQAIRQNRIWVTWSVRTCPRVVLVHRVFDQYSFWNHWGVPVGQAERLVTEPYAQHDDPELLAEVKHFAESLGLRYSITKKSNWNPPLTVRVEFWVDDCKPPRRHHGSGKQ